MNDISQNRSSPLVQAARWIAVFPVGLGILWIVEVLLNLLVDWALDWRPGGLLYYVVFIGGGLVLIVAMIPAARLAAITTRYLAPNARIGLLLFAAVYLTAQVVRMSQLDGDSEPVWQNSLMKAEFATVVAIVFTFAYRAEESRSDTDLPTDAEGT